MLMVPKACASVLTTCAPLFTTRVWPPVQVRRMGALLAPGTRTVTAAWRVRGLAHGKALQP